MKRRTFLKSLGALGAAPALPMSWLSTAAASTTASAAVPANTLQWAETIARAHRSCSTAMLQRHLRLDIAAANAVKSNLIKTGVIGAQADAFGMHKAAKPLFEGAFVRPNNVANPVGEIATDPAKQMTNHGAAPEPCAICDDPAIAIMQPMVEELRTLRA